MEVGASHQGRRSRFFITTPATLKHEKPNSPAGGKTRDREVVGSNTITADSYYTCWRCECVLQDILPFSSSACSC